MCHERCTAHYLSSGVQQHLPLFPGLSLHLRDTHKHQSDALAASNITTFSRCIGKKCSRLSMVFFMHVTALMHFHTSYSLSFFFNTIIFYVLKHLCEIAIQKAFLGRKVRSSWKKRMLCHFFPGIHQEENETNTQATSKGPQATLPTLLRSTEHCPVLVLQLPPLKLKSCFHSPFLVPHLVSFWNIIQHHSHTAMLSATSELNYLQDPNTLAASTCLRHTRRLTKHKASLTQTRLAPLGPSGQH